MKKLFKKIKNNLLVYIIWAIIAVVIVSFEVSFTTRLKDEQRISFFFSHPALNESEFVKLLRDNKPKYLKTITYRNVDYRDETTFMNVMSSAGLVDTDIFIFPKEAIDKFSPEGYFYELNEEKTNQIFNKTLTYYKSKDNYSYGIKIDSPYFSEEGKEFYLLYSKNSVHLGEFKKTSRNGNVTYSKLILES